MTVRLIGAVFGVIGLGWGLPWPKAEHELARLVAGLPLVGARVERLRAAIVAPVAPLTLMAEVLPFNFR